MERSTATWLGVGAVSLLIVAAAGVYLGMDDDPVAPQPAPAASSSAPTDPGTPPEDARLPEDSWTPVDEADWTTLESGLAYADLVVGDGAVANEGAPVVIEYTGWIDETGEMFDSSKRRARPLLFTMGRGDAPLPGWDEAVRGMRVGGKRQVVLPPSLAFGQTGRPPRIPRDATVRFEFELVDTTEPREAPESIPAYDASALRAVDGVQVVDLVEGDGDTIERGDRIALDYSAFIKADGRRFDSSLTRTGPARFEWGQREMLPGVEVGIVGMKEGGSRVIEIPPDLGYGPDGLRNFVPPDADLIFVVELVEIEGD